MAPLPNGRLPGTLGQADLHLHTYASDGLISVPQLVDYAEHLHLDVIAVTDHDEVSASVEAREYAARSGYHVSVVPGVEITTREGHLLALFVEARPPALRPLAETAEWVLQRGGLCIAPHPGTRLTHSISRVALGRAAERGLLAGVETLNASPAGRFSHPCAVSCAATYPVACIGSSDAHMLRIVGLARTRFPGTTAEDLRRAIEQRTTSAEGRYAAPAEIAAEALPQLARSMVHLPLRRAYRALREARAQAGA